MHVRQTWKTFEKRAECQQPIAAQSPVAGNANGEKRNNCGMFAVQSCSSHGHVQICAPCFMGE